MATFCFCPPERLNGTAPKKSLMPTVAACSSTTGTISRLGVASFSMAKAMSSATLSPTNCASLSCKTVPTTLLSPYMLLSRVSCPITVTLPVMVPWWENGISPFMQLASVLLPLPELPRISTFSPL